MSRGTTKLSHDVIKALYQVLDWYDTHQSAPNSQRVLRLYNIWRELHALSINISEEGWGALENIARILNMQLTNTERRRWLFLYSIETYLNIFIRAVALSKLGNAKQNLHDFYKEIGNRRSVFEPNVFEWVFDAAQDNDLDFKLRNQLIESLNTMLEIIYNLDLTYVTFDVFREIYQNILPREIRRGLGEFYTHENIVREVIQSANLDGNAIRRLYNEWREGKKSGIYILDPACGSGTFLVETIKLIFNSFTDRVPPDICNFIEDVIIGIDINPFAVEMAKLNVILTIMTESLKRGIYCIPSKVKIYWADSLARIKNSEKLYYKVLTINIPALTQVTGKESIGIPICPGVSFKEILDKTWEAVISGINRDAFVSNIVESLCASVPRNIVIKDVAELYDVMRKIHESGNSRILDLLMNTLAVQSLINSCAYIIGNPPWVRIRELSLHVRNYLRNNYSWLQRGSDYNPNFKKTKEPFREQFDYSVAFVERGLEFLGNGGVLSYVITSKIIRTLYAGKMREDLLTKYSIIKIIDYSLHRVPLFQDAVNYPLIISVQKSPPLLGHKVSITVFNTEGQSMNFDLGQSELPLDPNNKRSPWILAPLPIIRIVRTLHQRGVRLGDVYEVMRGVMTSLNDIYLGNLVNCSANNIARLEFKIGNQSQYVDIEEFLVHPAVRGEDIDPFNFTWTEYIIFPHDTINFEPLWDDDQRIILQTLGLLSSEVNIDASGGIVRYIQNCKNSCNACLKNANNIIQSLGNLGFSIIKLGDQMYRIFKGNQLILEIGIGTAYVQNTCTIEFNITGLKIPNASKATAHFRNYFKNLVKRDDYRNDLPPWAIFRVSSDKFKEYRIAWQEMSRHLEAAHLPVKIWDNKCNKDKVLIPIQTVYFIIEENIARALKLLLYLNSDFARNLIKLWAWSARGGTYRHTSYTIGLLPVPQSLIERNMWNFINNYIDKSVNKILDLNNVANKILNAHRDELINELLESLNISKDDYEMLVRYGEWLNETTPTEEIEEEGIEEENE